MARSSLFPELDDWDLHPVAYRPITVYAIGCSVDEKLHGHTKFHFIARYRLADRLYLACPKGLIQRGKVPGGWGLLECSGQPLAPAAPMHRVT